MGLVATLAVASSHVGAMRFMALGTQWNLAVYIVAETAGKAGVLALDLFQFGYLLGVACEALIGDVVSQFDDLGSMRVVVAP